MEKNSPTIKTTLARILQGREHWEKLVKMRKSPAIAYKIAKFIKAHLTETLQLIDEQRNEYIKLWSTAKEGEPPSINPVKDPEAVQNFSNDFSKYLETEIELPLIEVTMDQLVESMESVVGASVDGLEFVLMEIEDFFIKEAPAKA